MDLKDLIRRHEGERRNAAGQHVAYLDSKGNPTVGIGTLLTDPLAAALKRLWAEDDAAGPPRGEYLTMSDELADELLVAGMRDAEAIALRWLGARAFGPALSDVRRAVIIDLAYCLGNQLWRFGHLYAAIMAGDWPAAAREILDSDFAQQTGSRARELAEMIASDCWPT